MDRAQNLIKMDEDIGRLREIAQQGAFQQGLQLLPLASHGNDHSMDLFHEIMLHGDSGDRDFKVMVEEFIQLIEKKLFDAQFQMFDSK